MTRLLLIAEPRETDTPVRRFRLGRLLSEPKPLIDQPAEDE